MTTPTPKDGGAAINHEALDLLGELYEITGDDWLIEIDSILTEPVCPTCLIHAETDKDQPTFHFVADSFEEAINLAADAAIKHFGLRTTPTPGDDHE